MHYSTQILELSRKMLGNYSFDENRKQTFDCSAKKYLFEPFLKSPPAVALSDVDAIKAFKDRRKSSG